MDPGTLLDDYCHEGCDDNVKCFCQKATLVPCNLTSYCKHN